MMNEWLEGSGGWVALGIVGVLAVIAAIVKLLLRVQRSRARRDDDRRVGAPKAPPAAEPAPKAEAPRPSDTPTRPARRPEGIGAASSEPRFRKISPAAEPEKRREPAPAAVERAAPTQDYSEIAKAGAPAPAPYGRPLPQAAPAAAAPRVGEDMGEYTEVKVYYGTDRKDLGDNLIYRYNHERADVSAGGSPISYGVCTVTIPKTHQIGVLEDRTWTQWATWQGYSPSKHLMLQRVTAQDPTTFFETLKTAIANSQGKDAFVFVHGFSVSFTDAARRTAQMAFDLNFPGAPIFFSWPTPELISTNMLTAYTTSESNSDLSKHRFRAFLKDVLEKTGAATVHLIAHSMGNRLVTEALQMLDTVETMHLKSQIGEVILTAPDIDASVFITEIAPRITRFAPRVTLYASSKDKALEASQGVHSFPRIGEFQSLFSVPAGVEVIDASAAYDSQDGMGHSYYGDSEPVIADLCYLLSLGERAAKRPLTLASAVTPGGDACWSVIKRPLADVYAAIAARAR